MSYGKTVLSNGLTVLTMPVAGVRSVCVSIFVAVGSRYEADAQAGTSHFLEHILFKGCRRWPSARAISEAVEGIGGLLNAGTGREATMYWIKVAQPHTRLAIEVLADMLLHPLLDPAEIRKEQQVVIEEIHMLRDAPESLVQITLNELFWKDHPLGREISGREETVKSLTRQSLLDYIGQYYGPARTVVSVAGAIEPTEVLNIVGECFGEWPAAAGGRPAPYTADQHAPRAVVTFKDTEQAHLCLALPGLARNHPDQFALTMANTILGDGMSSRLFQEIRERQALAYSVDSSSSSLHDTGMLSVYAGVDPERALHTLSAVLIELQRLRDELVTPDELRRALEFNKGRLLLQMENTSSVASWYGSQEIYPGRVYSVDEAVAELERVTREDILRVAQATLLPDKVSLSAVGPFRDQEPFLARLQQPWA